MFSVLLLFSLDVHVPKSEVLLFQITLFVSVPESQFKGVSVNVWPGKLLLH